MKEKNTKFKLILTADIQTIKTACAVVSERQTQHHKRENLTVACLWGHTNKHTPRVENPLLRLNIKPAMSYNFP